MLYNTQWEKPVEVKTEEWREVLLRAAALIEQCGWVQGELGDTQHGFCSLGAIEEVTHRQISNTLENAFRIRSGYSDAIKQLGVYVHSGDIAAWNDFKQRTKRQVVEAMRAASEAR